MYSEEQQAVLVKVKDYTKRIEALMRERTAYMDENMGLFSKFHVGDPIYDAEGVRVGTVAELYRYQAGQNPLLDTSMDVDVRYKVGHDSYDNTSRTGTGTLGFRTEGERTRDIEYAFRRLKEKMRLV